jgi:hypothetical protein
MYPKKGMDIPAIKKILLEMASLSIQDSRIVNLLVDNIGEIRKDVMERQAQARHFYQTEIEGLN